ncbi:root phototropism protein 3-like [Musa acuminata AAA Group]|uniref:root phototropism protein 3-like n=1 Tax=Musa acuminata AAA Group TaxID=214697 RepID=UPI0031E266FA
MSSASPNCSSRKEKLPSPLPPPPSHDDRHSHHSAPGELSWLDNSCVQDLDHFAKTLTGIKAKGVRPELLGSILSHYASRWLPELFGRASAGPTPESPTAAWLKKRFFIETLASVLPTEKGSIPCDFLLKLLRTASMVGAEPSCVRELEARAAAQLDEASLKELMIPAFSHTCGTLLDVGLVLRLVQRFAGTDDGGAAAKSGAALARVAKLVDSYLAEVAVDAGLTVAEFEELASSLPAHARAMDDGLYRAIDTYIKAHPSTSKQERKTLCGLIDARKLSAEASLHAAQNERLPVRSVIQVLFSEHTKLNRLTDWSGSFSGSRSPNPAALEPPGRCPSKREVLVQQQEMRRLRDDVARLQLHCHALQAQIDKLTCVKKKRGFFRWASFLFLFRTTSDVVEKVEDYELGAERPTPMRTKKGRLAQGKGTPAKWRNSLS